MCPLMKSIRQHPFLHWPIRQYSLNVHVHRFFHATAPCKDTSLDLAKILATIA